MGDTQILRTLRSYERSNAAAVVVDGVDGVAVVDGVVDGVVVGGVDGVGVLGNSCGVRERDQWWWCQEVCRRGGPGVLSSEGRRWARSRSASGPGFGGKEAGDLGDLGDPGDPGDLGDLGEPGDPGELGEAGEAGESV